MAGWGKGVLIGLLALLPACQAMRTREFPSSRAGAEEAIAVALKQPTSTSVEFTVRKEVTAPPRVVWKGGHEVTPTELVTGVVLLRFDKAGFPTGETVNLPGNRASLAEARLALGRAQTVDRVIARSDSAPGEDYVWGWISAPPAGIALFDDGVCIAEDCADFTAIRSVLAVGSEAQSVPYPATREGVLAAKADPIAQDKMFGRVAVEIPRPSVRVWKPVNLYNVSVLEDERVCGLAMEFPLAAIERCYAYAQIEGLNVRDQTSSLTDVLADTATFPFRLVGAAAVAAAMSAH